MPFSILKKAVFLDRDGTLVEEGPYLSHPDDLRIPEGVVDALRLLKDDGFMLVLITNQSGIGRGFLNEETLYRIHEKLQRTLRVHEVPMDAIYYCPHLPSVACRCRKPEAGLFLKAIQEHAIDPYASFSIGDQRRDAEAAKKVGCTTILIGPDHVPGEVVDYQADDFSSAVRWILKQGI